MYEECFTDPDLECDGLEIEIQLRPYSPDYEPPDAPERPEAHINEWCCGCPYPAHGFVCWSRGGDCMRQRVARMDHNERR